MENIKGNEDLFKYMDTYFEKDEGFLLRPNHRAGAYPDLKDRMIGTDLKKRLEWVKNSTYKKRYGDPVQTSLYESFDMEDLAIILRTYDIEDKVKLKDAKFFEKMPMDTMQNLFLYNEALKGVSYEDLEMLAIEYAEHNRSSIVSFVISNEKTISKATASQLFGQIKDKGQKTIINERYGEKMGYWESIISHIKER